jgi:methylmalonyl-CoA/ethylmalonyl-CoA epimerase
MLFERVDHIAVAVENLDDALTMWEKVFGVRARHRELVTDFGVEIATIEAGGTAIELIEGKSPDSPIRKFVEKRGPGLHHVAFVVPDIVAALAQLRTEGVRLIDETPRNGKEGTRVAFVHPKAAGGVLYELVELP